MTDIKDSINDKQREIELLKAIHKAYPDAKKHKNRWGVVRYYTKDVNSKVTGCDITHNCGCCSDSALEVWPYESVNAVKIYSDPKVFVVGEKYIWDECDCVDDCDCTIREETAFPEWWEQMEKAGINSCVIEKVARYFKENGEIDGFEAYQESIKKI